ncbi:MAG TPA: hypothetical protein VFE96_08610 [Candidatus Bathyarchaeia archaeon]|nr:hypothetical protein [Candidatus Bathyarchaeia archaeon]
MTRTTELKVYLSEELDKRFRMLAMNAYGYGRGSLSSAAVDALTRWCEEHEAHQPDRQPKNNAPASDSDPAARAEERPGFVPGKSESASPAAQS